MKKKEEVESYRASVAAIIVNKNKEFFLVQQPGFKEDEWDFAKGGMLKGESEEETIQRELTEELGEDLQYKILRRSIWNIIYEWPIEHQIKKGFRGQARISFWVKYESGEINPSERELLAIKWFKAKDMKKILIQSGAREHEVKIFLDDWKMIQKEFQDEFVK